MKQLKEVESRQINVCSNFVLLALPVTVVCINLFYCLHVFSTVYN